MKSATPYLPLAFGPSVVFTARVVFSLCDCRDVLFPGDLSQFKLIYYHFPVLMGHHQILMTELLSVQCHVQNNCRHYMSSFCYDGSW